MYATFDGWRWRWRWSNVLVQRTLWLRPRSKAVLVKSDYFSRNQWPLRGKGGSTVAVTKKETLACKLNDVGWWFFVSPLDEGVKEKQWPPKLGWKWPFWFFSNDGSCLKMENRVRKRKMKQRNLDKLRPRERLRKHGLKLARRNCFWPELDRSSVARSKGCLTATLHGGTNVWR